MLLLGYETYIAQGGDWGSFICRALGIKHGDNCKAIHINMFVTAPPSKYNPLEIVKYLVGVYSSDEMQGLYDSQTFIDEGTGYQAIQGTRPQTLNYALTDSPVGMLAWIREKMHAWTDSYPWTNDEIITWVMLYYANSQPATQIYAEFRPTRWQVLSTYVPTPTGVSIFPKEIYRMPRSWAEKVANVVSWTTHGRGGHFAATEQPELLVADVQALIRTLKASKQWTSKAKF